MGHITSKNNHTWNHEDPITAMSEGLHKIYVLYITTILSLNTTFIKPNVRVVQISSWSHEINYHVWCDGQDNMQTHY